MLFDLILDKTTDLSETLINRTSYYRKQNFVFQKIYLLLAGPSGIIQLIRPKKSIGDTI